jgi:hypothetical protein
MSGLGEVEAGLEVRDEMARRLRRTRLIGGICGRINLD